MIAIKSPNDLFCDLHDLQRAGVMVDTRLILDDGELSIHWPLLDLYGDQQWWSGLGKAGGDNAQWESALAVGGQLLFIYFISYFPSKYQFPPSLTGVLRLY